MVLRAGTFIALLLIPVLYLVISNLLLNPLRLVNQAHKRLQEGDLDYRIQEKANSIEYSYSFLSFNQMADQIKTLKIENYEKELDRQKMELKNLQLQIHPHFLLNTFNLVYTLAQRKETGAIQDIVIYLSVVLPLYFPQRQKPGTVSERTEADRRLYPYGGGTLSGQHRSEV